MSNKSSLAFKDDLTFENAPSDLGCMVVGTAPLHQLIPLNLQCVEHDGLKHCQEQQHCVDLLH